VIEFKVNQVWREGDDDSAEFKVVSLTAEPCILWRFTNPDDDEPYAYGPLPDACGWRPYGPDLESAREHFKHEGHRLVYDPEGP
jgi:hypothetical protein